MRQRLKLRQLRSQMVSQWTKRDPTTCLRRSSLGKSGALRRLPGFRLEQLQHSLPKVALYERVHRAVRVQNSIPDKGA
jgi:hypothetical protein